MDLNSKLSPFDRHFGCASNSCLRDSLRDVPRGPCRQKVEKRVWICLVQIQTRICTRQIILNEAWSCSIQRRRERLIQGS